MVSGFRVVFAFVPEAFLHPTEDSLIDLQTGRGFSLGGNPFLFPPEKSGTEQRRTRLARANSDWENELGATALFSKHFKLVFVTLALIFVLLIVLAFIADFAGKTSANLWQFAALVGGWIGGMLSAIGILPTD